MSGDGTEESLADAALVRPHGRVAAAPVRAVRKHEGSSAVALTTIAAVNTASTILDARRSRRGGGRITLAALASVLLASNRIVTFDHADDGYQRTWRPCPSAGGRHPIDVLVDARTVESLECGVYWFDPVHWSLRTENGLDDHLAAARGAVADAVVTDSPPGAVLFLIAQFERTASRYDHPATLVWRDAGALMTVIQLAATGAGLSSCPAGIGGTVRLPGRGADVGAVVLGSG